MTSSVASDDVLHDDETSRGLPIEIARGWSRVAAALPARVGEREFETWLRSLAPGACDGDELTLTLPSPFLRDWVRGHHGDLIENLVRAEMPEIARVIFGVAPRPGSAISGTRPSAIATTPDAAPPVSAQPTPPQQQAAARADRSPAGDLAAPLDDRYTFDSFVVGKPNEFAYACARRVAERPSSPGFNPLFLYGGVGLGKTHLMHAIGGELTRSGRVSVAYMSAEKFMYRFIAAIRSQSTMEFKEQLRSVDVLMIDDLQFLIGKESTQEEFFHTFNALVDAGKQIVVSSDKSPSDLSGIEDRLRTRLGCGMVADVHATNFELRMAILSAKANSAQVSVPPKVMEFLAHKITTNVRELEGALNRLIARAKLVGAPISIETVPEVLHDILRAHDRRLTIEEIQKRVAEHFHIRLTEMTSSRRARAVARPRQVAMYLSKQLTGRSLPEIGRRFGDRDHTTVMHAVTRVQQLMETDAAFAEDVELLRRMLES